MKAGNQSLLKKNNQQAIINYILKNGAISRADLSKCLDITKPTVSSNVAELISLSILTEIGFSTSYIGKKPMLVNFNKDFQYVLALDYISYRTRNIVLVSVCNLFCETIFSEQLNLGKNYSAEIMNEVMPIRILELLNINDILIDRIGVVVVTAATANYSNGLVVYECANGEFVNLAKIIADIFSQPVVVKNDINLATIGEKYFGVGKEVDNLAFAWMGIAVGGGVMLNGELYEGISNGGGELANTIVYNELNGEYEYMKNMLSMTGVIKYISKNKEKAKQSTMADKLFAPTLRFDDIVQGVEQGDQFCVDYIEFTAKKITEVVSNLCAFLDLEMIIIGGEYSHFQSVISTLENHINQLPLTKTIVTTPKFTNSAMYGAFKVGVDYIIESLLN